ncbi:MAG: OmpA family protein [Hahellaceae bacterium]|nr:OmpA family protein [Hahellaceae bacterium]MCP5209955.1 OmpA family protein [Hahellaceae bacterium]
MKTLTRTKLSLVIPALLYAAMQSPLVMADDDEEAGSGIYVSGGWNKVLFDSDRAVEDDNDFYAGLGYHMTPQTAVEVTMNRADTVTKGPAASDAEFNYWSLSLLHRFTPINESGFFARAGLGVTTVDTEFGVNENEGLFKIGTGYDIHINDYLVAQLAIDGALGLEREKFDVIPSAGLLLYMGLSDSTNEETYAMEDEQYKDTDNDGVADNADKCPQSEPGVDVDGLGCAIVVAAVVEEVVLDSDGDGVNDDVDACPDTEPEVVVDETGCNAVLVETVSMDLHIRFPNNSSIIPKSFYPEVEKVAAFMKQYPDTKAVLEGYTDSKGDDAYNLMLSERRANSVQNILINKFAISADRLTAEGKGEANPIASNDTEAGRDQNRRVVVSISNASE